MKISILILLLICSACSNSGKNSNSPDTPNKPAESQTQGGSTDCTQPQIIKYEFTEIAKSFNDWRTRCNPTEEQLNSALLKL